MLLLLGDQNLRLKVQAQSPGVTEEMGAIAIMIGRSAFVLRHVAGLGKRRSPDLPGRSRDLVPGKAARPCTNFDNQLHRLPPDSRFLI
jgi:hypothetical protein